MNTWGGGWSQPFIWRSMGVCTFAFVPGGVEALGHMPSLTLHHQDREGHLTHGAEVSRRLSLRSPVCLNCLTGRRQPRGHGESLYTININTCARSCTSICLDCLRPLRGPDWGSSALSPGGFPGGAPPCSGSCRLWCLCLLLLLQRLVLPDVIFTLVPLWHVEKKSPTSLMLLPGDHLESPAMLDNIPRVTEKRPKLQ